jgi:hypothetical protein
MGGGGGGVQYFCVCLPACLLQMRTTTGVHTATTDL